MKSLVLLDTNKHIELSNDNSWLSNGYIEAGSSNSTSYIAKTNGYAAPYEQLTITSIYDVRMRPSKWFVED